MQRITAHVSATFYHNDRLTTRFSASGNMRDQRAPGALPQRRNTALGSYERDFDINPFAYALGTSRTLRPYGRGGREYYRNNWAPFNILSETEANRTDIDVLDLKLQGEADYQLLPQLKLQGLVAVRRAATTIEHSVTEASNLVAAHRAAETPMVMRDNVYLLHSSPHPYALPQVALTHGGLYNRTDNRLQSLTARIAADYDRTIGPHDIKAFAFAELRTTDRVATPFSGYGIQYERAGQVYTNPLIFQKLAAEQQPYFAHTTTQRRGATLSASATYGWAGRYVANAVLDYEGANTARGSNGSHWLPTWNVGFKWNAMNEDFLRGHDYITKLALRASYGLTAKMNEMATAASAVYLSGITQRPQLNEREGLIDIAHLENRDLSWEKMYELNLGLDLALWNGRLALTADVYQRDAFDLIDLIRTSGIGGQYYKYANFGDMRTRGVELALTTKNIDRRHFTWTTTLTAGAMRQEITRLLNTPNAFDMVAGRGAGNIVGYPKGSLFSYNFQGLDAQGLPTFDFGLYPTTGSPTAKYAGADFSDVQYTKTYLLYHGPIEPQITGGLANTLRWKQWELSAFLTVQAGNKLRLNPTYDPTFADLNVFSGEYYRRWLNPGDELHTDVPTIPSVAQVQLLGRETIERAYNTYNYSQMRVADGSFVRLKNVALAYTFTPSQLRDLHLSRLSLRLNATNPVLLYADSRLRGQDPEYYKTGGVSTPTPRQYTLTVNIGF